MSIFDIFRKKKKEQEPQELQMPYAPSKDELQGMDRGPLTSDKVRRAAGKDTVSSRSVRSLIIHVEEYNANMSALKIPNLGSDQTKFMNELAETNGQAFELMQGMQKYLIQKARGYAEKGKKYQGLMGLCSKAAADIEYQMKLVNVIQGDCMYALRKGENVPSGKSYIELLKTTTMKQETDLEDKKYVGGGQMNTLYSMKDEKRGKDRVLKEGFNSKSEAEMNDVERDVFQGRIRQEKNRETGAYLESEREYEQMFTSKKLKAPEKFRLNSANRDVAVSVIDKLFGLNAATETTLAMSAAGKQASFMDKEGGVNGNSAMGYMNEKEKIRNSASLQMKICMLYLKNGRNAANFSERDADDFKEFKSKKHVAINSTAFLESSINLAALDIIVGHVDRHSGNVMVSENGLKAIDNDTAFSLWTILPEDRNSFDLSEERKFFGARNQNQATLNLKDTFPKVTKAFKQKICNVPVSAVRGALKGLLMPEEIDACVTRVTQLQEYLQNVTEIDSFDEIDRNDYYNQVESGGMVAMNYASQIKKKTNDMEKKDHFASKFYDFHNYYTKNLNPNGRVEIRDVDGTEMSSEKLFSSVFAEHLQNVLTMFPDFSFEVDFSRDGGIAFDKIVQDTLESMEAYPVKRKS